MPILLVSTNTEIPGPWTVASQLQEGRKMKKFTKRELKALPSKLPRLSVLGVGNLVGLMTSSIAPDIPEHETEAKEELKKLQNEAKLLLAELEEHATAGAKITDLKDGKKIGEIIAPPVKGTNVALAMMRLDRVGLLGDNAWDRMNRVKLGEGSGELRFLPYLPLWWPTIDEETGKELVLDEDDDDDEEDNIGEEPDLKEEERNEKVESESKYQQ